ncbi:MAG TPA: copper chaperone PCu(A)C [Pseudomonadales bacterium]|nr:copper chaperone PCu(A)C [Pseudomonadales bacterium]
MARGKTLLLLLATLLPLTAPGADRGLSARDAWIREAPPGRSVLAAYVEFANGGDAPITLVSAASPAAERVEFHAHRHEDGMMRMRRVDQVEVPAQGTLAFAPGGLHLMLFGTAAPRAGARLEVTFETADGDTLSVTFPVRNAMSDAGKPGVMR